MQPQGHVQVLVNLIDFGMNVQAAGDAARVRHDGSATPTGQPADADGGKVFVEPASPTPFSTSSNAAATLPERQSGGNFGGYQGILIDWENGVLIGGSEPRKDGAAVGW